MDRTLTGILARGKSILNDYAGAEQDYDTEGLPRQLLFDYCRYARSHAAEMFSVNYSRELITLRELTEMKEKANENQNPDRISDV